MFLEHLDGLREPRSPVHVTPIVPMEGEVDEVEDEVEAG
jgi:hypothetical protein